MLYMRATVRVRSVGKGIIRYSPLRTDNVLYIEGLKVNLLSVSQLRDKGHEVVF